jgi:hypothetical protein
VAIGRGPTLETGTPHALMRTNALFPGSIFRMSYDVNADGQRFLVSQPVEGAGTAPITVVLNWLSGLR